MAKIDGDRLWNQEDKRRVARRKPGADFMLMSKRQFLKSAVGGGASVLLSGGVSRFLSDMWLPLWGEPPTKAVSPEEAKEVEQYQAFRW